MVAPSLKPFRRTFGHLAEHRAGLFFGFICSSAWAVLALVFTDLAGNVVDLVEGLARNPGDEARAALLRACLLLFSVRCAEIVCRFFGGRTVQTISRRVEASMKNELVSHVSSLPASWFDRARTGDLISRLTQDVGMLRRLAGPTVLQFSTTLIIVPGGMYMVLRMSPNLFLAMIAAFVVVMLGVSRLIPRLKRSTRRVQESIARLSQRSSEDFTGIRVLSTFGRSRHQSELMGGLCDEYLERSIALTRIQARLNVIVQSCRHLSVLGVLVVGAFEAMAGRVSLGDMFQLLLLSSVIVRPLLGVSTGLASLHGAAAAAERVEELFAAQPESRAGLAPNLRGKIDVRNLTFRYAPQARPVLSDVSFSLEAGGKLGLVGPAGSGKSTLLALLTRSTDRPSASFSSPEARASVSPPWRPPPAARPSSPAPSPRSTRSSATPRSPSRSAATSSSAPCDGSPAIRPSVASSASAASSAPGATRGRPAPKPISSSTAKPQANTARLEGRLVAFELRKLPAMDLTERIALFVVLATAIVGATSLFIRRGNRKAKRRKRIWTEGVAVTATVVSVEETGAAINDRPKVRMVLDVAVPDREVQRVTHEDYIFLIAIPRVQPGCEIAARAAAADRLDGDDLVLDPALVYDPW